MAIIDPESHEPQHPADALLDAMVEIVAMNLTWQEKKQLILSACNETQQTALEEFISWWDETP